jgi:hypothetical protein
MRSPQSGAGAAIRVPLRGGPGAPCPRRATRIVAESCRPIRRRFTWQSSPRLQTWPSDAYALRTAQDATTTGGGCQLPLPTGSSEGGSAFGQ